MKGKTRRKIKRFWLVLFSIYGIVIAIGYPIVLNLIKPLVETSAVFSKLQMHFPGWYLLMCFWFIVAVIFYIIGKQVFHIYSKALAPEINDFEEINFGKPGENTILNVINGLLNAEKVEPFYVHAAPKSKEVESVCSKLKETGFAMISGGPGEGKSMVTYHSAYKFKEEERYYIYRLKVELLEDKTGKEIIDKILFQLDDLKGKRKLIMVDDAHKLAIKQDINIIMQQEAEEGHGKYIWVETEFYEEKKAEIQPNMYIRVDFQEFFENLLKNFYQSQDPFFQEALKGRIEGLDDAIDRVKKGKIQDVWWFAFVASQGEERLSQEIYKLTKLEMQVLFLISAYTVLSREAELSRNYLLNKLENLKWGWLTNDLRSSSFSDVIKLLQKHTQIRKSMIRVYDKSERDRGYIASLHYNFARNVIRASLFRADLIEDLLSSVEELLTSEYHKCAYIGAFHDEIGVYAADFDRKNKDWLISFVNNILPEKLQCYPRILKGIKSVAIEIYDEIIRKVNIDGIAEKVNSTEASLFHKLAHLLKAMGGRRNELIKKLDLKQLSGTANSAEIVEFAHLAYLLDAMGGRRNELIEKLDLKQLSKKANNAEIVEFGQLVHLLYAMGDRRKEFVEKLDLKQLSRKVNGTEVGQFEQLAKLLDVLSFNKNQVSIVLDYGKLIQKANQVSTSSDIRGLTIFLAKLDEKDRNEFIYKVDWYSICLKLSLCVNFFKPLGAILGNLWKQAESSFDNSRIEKVAKYLKANTSKLIQEIIRANPKHYSGVAKFLWNCNQIDHALAKRITSETMSKLAERFGVKPTVYRGVGQLVNAFTDIDPNLSADFVKSDMVRGKIQRSINMDDWSKEIEGLKHLIKAFYRSAPDLWRKMVNLNWIFVDLNSLDFNSIYREVDEKKNVGTAHNTT